jgi:hypothetical protein
MEKSIRFREMYGASWDQDDRGGTNNKKRNAAKRNGKRMRGLELFAARQRARRWQRIVGPVRRYPCLIPRG